MKTLPTLNQRACRRSTRRSRARARELRCCFFLGHDLPRFPAAARASVRRWSHSCSPDDYRRKFGEGITSTKYWKRSALPRAASDGDVDRVAADDR